MKLAERIEVVTERYDHVLWWQTDEAALVFAGQEVTEPIVVTDFSATTANNLGRLTLRSYYSMLASMYDTDADSLMSDSPALVPISVDNGLVKAAIPKTTIEWLGTNRNHAKQWMLDAVDAIKYVRTRIVNAITDTTFDDADIGTSVNFHVVEGAPDDVQLLIPHLVLNPLGCSCIGSDPSDRRWQEIREIGYVELRQHNVDSYVDSLPIAAGLAALNTVRIQENDA